VIVAVAIVRVVQVVVDEVVDVIAVRHLCVAARRSMHVPGLVPRAHVAGRAALGMRRIDRDRALVHVIAVRVMQVAIVQVVDVTVVA
jgi:hypothetical protein